MNEDSDRARAGDQPRSEPSQSAQPSQSLQSSQSPADEAARELAEYRERRTRQSRAHRRDALVDQAVGIIMARSGHGSAEAVAQLAAIARRSRRPLAEVAADVVGEASGAADVDVDAPPAPDTVRLHPGVAGLDRASDGDDLARVLLTEALGFSGAAAAAVGVLDDDGTIAILGSAGFPAREVRRWRRIPPAVDCLVNRAVRGGRPVWVDSTGAAGVADRPPAIGDTGGTGHGPRVAAPIRSGRMLIGVIELAWPASAAAPDSHTRREVEAVVQSTGAALLRMLGPDLRVPEPMGTAGESAWQDVLDLFAVPAFVVTGLADERGGLDRLRVAARNDAAAELMAPEEPAAPAGPAPDDRALSVLVPWLTGAGLPETLATVARTGAPRGQRVDTGRLGVDAVSVARVGPGSVLVVCQRAVDTAAGAGAGAGLALERLARFGTWSWEPARDRVHWSAEALRIAGAPALGGPSGIDRPPFTVHPDDAEAERRFIKSLTTEGRSAEVEVRIVHYGGEPTRVRLAAEAIGGAGGSGTPAAVLGVIQDVTDWRRAETALEVVRVQLAALRSRADAERQLALALQQAIVPGAARNQPPHSGVEVAARYRPASTAAGVGGDWYSVFPLADGKLLLAIGDVAGHGLPAASAMADMHHGLRGMALAETRPGRLLTLLNELVDGMPDYTIASACCLLWDPATRRLTWGNAGHPAPIRMRGDQAWVLDDHVGSMLGADPAAVYEDAELAVDSGDVLLLYTDGLVERRRAGEEETIAHLLDQARDPDADLDRYLDRILGEARSDTDDDVCVVAIRFD